MVKIYTVVSDLSNYSFQRKQKFLFYINKNFILLSKFIIFYYNINVNIRI